MKKLALCALLLLGGSASAAPILVTGAGATFPYPLYSKWFAEYNKLFPDIRFNYQSIGSGGGIQQFTNGTVEFGASDAPMSDEEIAKVGDVVHIPTVLGAVVVTYNAPGVTSLKLSAELLAGIYLGKVKKWSDPALAKVNPGVKFPDVPITVVRRSDGSGTTYVFTDYLSKVSAEWKSKVGTGKSVSWPAGLGGKGNEGVTGLIKQTPGSIGYVELAYANQNKLPLTALENKAGTFVTPSIESTSAAAAGVTMPSDYRVSLTNGPGPGAYPIASFTYLLVHRDMKDPVKGNAIVRFLWWAVRDGQQLAGPLDYAPLPKSVVALVEKTIQGLQVQGKPVSLASSK